MVLKDRLKKSLEAPVRQFFMRVEPLVNQSRMRIVKLTQDRIEVKIFHNWLTQNWRKPDQLSVEVINNLVFEAFFLLLEQKNRAFQFHFLQKYQIEWFSEVGILNDLKFKLQITENHLKAVEEALKESTVASMTLTGFFYSISDQLVGQCYWDFQVKGVDQVQ
ncbi:MAG: hypothetical protein NZ480_02800 [Bdellovibrionaceae bacterium]|nr:hypothetical protein [Pseudobdellovibrionaceae bacterium]MDW8190621.1 hypothetical protein [Pseudobdellovibrionaceae bacterium]